MDRPAIRLRPRHTKSHTIAARVLFVVFAVASALHATQQASAQVWPDPNWQQTTPEQAGMDAAMLQKAREYALSGGGSGCIVRSGRLVMSWGDLRQRYDLKSTTKGIGVTALGLAIKDGKVQSLDDRALKYHPDFGVPPQANKSSDRLERITLFHLATQTAGFDKNGGYTELLFEPGTKWSYSDGGPNWLAECLTLAYNKDINDLLFERVFGPIGIGPADLTWRENAYRPRRINGITRREFGSGISANTDAMARIGYLYLRRGRWQGRQIIPASFVDAVGRVPHRLKGLPVLKPENYFNASDHYGLLWWNNADGTMANVPHDTYWTWGLYDSLIVVMPSLDIVAARAGRSLNKTEDAAYGAIEPFIEPIALSIANKSDDSLPPYPASSLIKGIDWSPVETVVRQACGSDNWPITWADDDNQYTAFGDGWGFGPTSGPKLSLGIAKVSGSADNFRGTNIRSESGQRLGDGAKGPKAGGMLMVNGVLYMLVRNVGNSQLAWSRDHGESWHWSEWKFAVSFGCPTFLNFGRNYAGAADEYVYVYSHDSDSAYTPADRMVLARVRAADITHRASYEFFKALDDSGGPIWTTDINRRGAVFSHRGRCYRSGITYNAGIKRYLWCQTIVGQADERLKGGLGIFEAPQPWGPWATVYYTPEWDIGPGETSCLPTKWMSEDGSTCHLVFSGDDCFCVRRAKLTLNNRR